MRVITRMNAIVRHIPNVARVSMVVDHTSACMTVVTSVHSTDYAVRIRWNSAKAAQFVISAEGSLTKQAHGNRQAAQIATAMLRRLATADLLTRCTHPRGGRP